MKRLLKIAPLAILLFFAASHQAFSLSFEKSTLGVSTATKGGSVVTRTGKSGLKLGKKLTDKQAIARLRRGQDVMSNSRQKAKQLMKRASGNGKVIKDNPHRPGQYPHYHDASRNGGHAFWP